MRTGDRNRTTEIFKFVSAHQAIYLVKTICCVLDVSTNGYYVWRKWQPSQRTQEGQRLLKRIHAIHKRSKGTYGAPRIHAESAEAGIHVGRKRVARLEPVMHFGKSARILAKIHQKSL